MYRSDRATLLRRRTMNAISVLSVQQRKNSRQMMKQPVTGQSFSSRRIPMGRSSFAKYLLKPFRGWYSMTCGWSPGVALQSQRAAIHAKSGRQPAMLGAGVLRKAHLIDSLKFWLVPPSSACKSLYSIAYSAEIVVVGVLLQPRNARGGSQEEGGFGRFKR